MTVPPISTGATATGATAVGATVAGVTVAARPVRADVEDYLGRVRTAFADLDPEERGDLLDDLEVHLHEVAAEPGDTLVGRLGEPERYARELRASAGLTEPPAWPGRAYRAQVLDRADAGLAELQRRLEGVPGWPRLRAFWPELRPGWWVLRGYLVAWVLCAAALGDETAGLLPRVNGSAVLGLVLVGLTVWGSVRLGRRAGRLRQGARVGLVVGTACLLLAVPFYGAGSYAYVRYVDSGTTEVIVEPDGSLTDLYPYDADGRPLTGVRLYDQDGNPVLLGERGAPERQPVGGRTRNVYPRAPLVVLPSPTPGPDGYVEPTEPGPPASVPPLVPRASTSSAPPASSPSTPPR